MTNNKILIRPVEATIEPDMVDIRILDESMDEKIVRIVNERGMITEHELTLMLGYLAGGIRYRLLRMAEKGHFTVQKRICVITKKGGKTIERGMTVVISNRQSIPTNKRKKGK